MTSPALQKKLDQILTLHPKVIDLSLERIMRLLEALDHPERKLPPTLHVAGTNGKGSTCAYLTSIYQASGYKVHRYTSPHLVRFNERVLCANEEIGDGPLIIALDRCLEANGDQPITFFELTTCAAFLLFSEIAADVLILEVGLGGRLDATNVIPAPLACLITPISLDHQDFLGNDLGAIALEKAGILKKDIPAFVGKQDPAAMRVLELRAEEIGTPLLKLERFEDLQKTLPTPSMLGQHQADNALLAAACASHLHPTLPLEPGSLEQGLLNTQWPARMQRLDSGPLTQQVPHLWEVWLDGGHNPQGGQILANCLASLPPKPTFLILGMMQKKDVAAFLTALKNQFQAAHTVAIPDQAKSFSAAALAETVQATLSLPTQAQDSLTSALQACAKQSITDGIQEARVVIAGSLYLAGHVLSENQLVPLQQGAA